MHVRVGPWSDADHAGSIVRSVRPGLIRRTRAPADPRMRLPMKTHIAGDTLVETIRVCRILEATQLDALAREPWARIASPDELALELLRRGWLTPYQVDQLARGRGGDLVLGAYLVLDALGEGGMGRVLKARHRRMNRTVAL